MKYVIKTCCCMHRKRCLLQLHSHLMVICLTGHIDAHPPSCSLLASVLLSLHSWEPGSSAADLHTTCEGQFSDTVHACMQDVTAKIAGEAGRKKRSPVPF